ncbi:MAG: CDP-glycerol glycerophosphotransferase family protein, partial [Micromonosporaceae bacterium]
MPLQTIFKLYDKVGPNGLPTAAVAAFALTRWPWLGYLLVVATLAYGWWRYKLNGLNKHRMGRVLAVAAVLIEVARPTVGGNSNHDIFAAGNEDGLGLPLALTGVILIGLVAQESMLSKALTSGKLRTANLGVTRGFADRALDPRWAYLLTSALTVAFLASAMFSFMSWSIAIAAIAVAVVFAAAVLAAWRERRREAHVLDAEVHAAVEAVQPTFMVHFAAPPGSEYQLLMWLPYFEMIGEPFVIVLREGYVLRHIAEATDRPIVVAPSIANLEHMVTDTVRTVFYVNNGMKNTHCVRFGHLTHVQLLHGDSDKAASFNPITSMFDLVYVAGQAGIDRYHKNGVNIPNSRFRIVGRPQVADVTVVNRPISAVEKPTVMYAPTWTGNSSDVNYSSIAMGEKIVGKLLERGATVILRAHPYTRRNPASANQLERLEQILAADKEKTGRAHRYGRAVTHELSLFECINAADAMITDVSAVASDWLYSEKPFATTDMQNEG